LAVLEGHTDSVFDVQELSDGRLLSWSGDGTLRLWNSNTGVCIELIHENQLARKHPDLWRAHMGKMMPEKVAFDFFLSTSPYAPNLHHRTSPEAVASWNADSWTTVGRLLKDGTTVVGLESGQVCILNLHHGNRRISLSEAEEILASQREFTK
jgi:WD40 repeat protein